MPGPADRTVPVTLLGTPVTAHVALNEREHRRRAAIGLGAVTDPALLDLLLNLPLGVPVADPVAWAATAAQLDGIAACGRDGRTVTRHLDAPLYIRAVVVTAGPGRDLRAVQDASLFAGFCRRWVATARPRAPVAAVLEAKLVGVGLVGPGGQVQLAAEQPVGAVIDCWAWMLWEQAYRGLLRQRPRLPDRAASR
jgi:hypothetical protein